MESLLHDPRSWGIFNKAVVQSNGRFLNERKWRQNKSKFYKNTETTILNNMNFLFVKLPLIEKGSENGYPLLLIYTV